MSWLRPSVDDRSACDNRRWRRLPRFPCVTSRYVLSSSLHLAWTSAASPVASAASTDFKKTLLSAPNQGHPGNVGLSCLRLREGSLAVTSIRCEHIGHGCRNSAAACHIRWLAHLRQTHRIRDAEPDVGGSQFCSRRSCHVALDPCCSPGRFVLRLKNAVLNVYCPDCIKEHWLEFFFIW